MGHSLSFQALPEKSRLFVGLKKDAKLGTLVAPLFHCGGGAFTWSSLEDLDEILEGVAAGAPELFGSRTEVEKVMEELVRRLEETRAAHPGIEDRRRSWRRPNGKLQNGCPGNFGVTDRAATTISYNRSCSGPKC
jgi:hypothetical protein